mmetsp:Transcript_31950/g.61568  ORF Transcript_31950/g.61568 Transcript_31950/m.61568 type:complete len:612 (+) Transcript_31950:313-2148(+)
MSSSILWFQVTKHFPRTNHATITTITTRSMGFKPRRTPPPSISGVNLSPRPTPSGVKIPPPPPMTATVVGSPPPPSSPPTPFPGGRGQTNPDWISPHHKDYYGKIDESTLDHPYLLHGDPHMPISRLARRNGVVILGEKEGEPAREIRDYRDLENLPRILTGEEDEKRGKKAGKSSDSEEVDDLAREFGPSAANEVRAHLFELQKKQRQALMNAKKSDGVDGDGGDGKGEKKYVYSPLQDIEEQFRIIDRMTAAPGSTQDLALMRRGRTEAREFDSLGKEILGSGAAGLTDGGEGDLEGVGDGYHDIDNLLDGEFGKGRRYDPEAVFGIGASTTYPFGEEKPSFSYHPDFPNEFPSEAEQDEKWMEELNKLIYEEKYTELGLGEIDSAKPVGIQEEDMEVYMKEKQRTKKWNMLARENGKEKNREEDEDEILEMIKRGEDPNQEAFGPWGECTIKVDRVQKVERGGTTVRYRALLIGGNGNGAAGFGIGKALSPNEAMLKASKHCKRNVFYINRYMKTGLCYDLAGRHNSCKVQLRAVRPNYGLHGHPLICEILKYAGITDASTKSHGNRNVYNVVYATFKALMTHESLEDIALKRGKKFVNLQRARRLGI